MTNLNSQEINWVYTVLNTVDKQKSDGVEVPVLETGLQRSVPGPAECFSMLGEFGIKVACYRDGEVLLEPAEQYPMRGTDSLMLSQRGDS